MGEHLHLTMENSTLILVVALLGGGYVLSQSEGFADWAEETTNRDLTDANNATGEDSDEWAERTETISDAVDEQVRNEERFAGVPVSPYQ